MTIPRFSLGDHWDDFVRNEVASGRYGSADEVLRDGLRALEERNARLDALRAHVAEGAEDAAAGRFADYSLEALIADLDREA